MQFVESWNHRAHVSRALSTGKSKRRSRISRSVAASIEQLEKRQLLNGASVFALSIGSVEVANSVVVTSTADEDDGTSDPSIGTGTNLREAVNYENANGGGTITFDPSLTASGAATITLSQTGDSTAGPSGLGIDSKITSQGPTSGNVITISGVDSQRLFYVASTGTMSLDDLTINGDSAGNRGGPNSGSSVTD
jgi:hypothetical protein